MLDLLILLIVFFDKQIFLILIEPKLPVFYGLCYLCLVYSTDISLPAFLFNIVFLKRIPVDKLNLKCPS